MRGEPKKNIPGKVINGPKKLPTMTSIFVWPSVSFNSNSDCGSSFFDKKLHASWIHLHLPSSPDVAKNFIDATQITFSKHS